MSRFRFALATAMATGLVSIGNTAVSAQVFCGVIGPPALATTYNGYSNHVAKSDKGKGTSTILAETSVAVDFDDECNAIGTRTVVTERYIDGPGNSKFEKRNPVSTSCEATGTLSCP